MSKTMDPMVYPGGSQYLVYVELDTPGRKTKIIEVRSLRSGDLLGVIKWFNRWRQYCFWPEPGTIFNFECITHVGSVLDSLRKT